MVSLGAAVVIFGAMAKILHLSWADWALKIGLTTEACIFIIYAFLPPPDMGAPAPAAVDNGNPALKTMEKMLLEADITPANLGKLSEGFKKLGSTVDKLGEIGDVVKSTTDFAAKSKEATAAMGSVSTALTGAAQNLSSFESASQATKEFHLQVQGLTKNLTALNTVYELELQESNNHLKALNQFYGKLSQASAAMTSSAEDAIKAKEQIAALAGNLSRLNQVYGSMLSAMQGK